MIVTSYIVEEHCSRFCPDMRFVIHLIAATLLIQAVLVGVISANTRYTRDDFLITKWTTEDGLPQNTVTSILQTRDGYIWVGTFGGLARFDGIKFTVFDAANTPGFNANRILSLYEDSWGRLWIGTESGEVYLRTERGFEEFAGGPIKDRRTVWGFIEGPGGQIYFSSDSGVERFDLDAQGNVMPGSEKIMTGTSTFGLSKDGNGRVWVRVSGAMYMDSGERLVPANELGVELPVGVQASAFADDGRLFIGARNDAGVFQNGRFSGIDLGPRGLLPSYGLIARGNTLWYQTMDELAEVRGYVSKRYDLEGIVQAGSRALIFDSEDNLWLATHQDGLIKLTKRQVRTWGRPGKDGDPFPTYAIIEDRNSTVWVGGTSLLRIEAGDVGTVKRTEIPIDSSLIQALAVDADNALWLGSPFGLYRNAGNRIEKVAHIRDQSINALFFDRDGLLWIGASKGLYTFRDGVLDRIPESSGLPDTTVYFVTQSRDGRMLVGTGNGLGVGNDGNFVLYTTEEGLSGNFVREIVEDADGALWIGTYGGGISRLKNGEFRSIKAENGIADNFVSRMILDDADNFWILGNHGISVVSRSELSNVADGLTKFAGAGVYSVLDGMGSSEGNGGHQPAGFKMRNGSIWFPMIDGFVAIDPRSRYAFVPKVVVEEVRSRTETGAAVPLLPESGVIDVKNKLRNVEIEFTGLSYTKPGRMRFFYKLDGIDSDWVDAGSRRTAFYPYLPAGEYRFVVRALSADGKWSAQDASIQLNIEPHFWETWAFYILCGVIVLVLGLTAVRIKTAQLESRNLLQREFSRRLINAHEKERQRIARELHDGLGQNLLLIKNWASLGHKPEVGEEELRTKLQQISETAGGSLDETRAILNDLSPQHIQRFGLTASIQQMIEQVQNSSGILFETELDDLSGVFSYDSEISIYRIIQEALNNIVKHSETTHATIGIERDGDTVDIRIRDFGKGMRSGTGQSRRTSLGLESMGQRVNLIGGTLQIETGEGGTLLHITLNGLSKA